MEEFSSQLLENAVKEFASLPGIGRKTATRLVLFLLKKDQAAVENFGNAIIDLKQQIRLCSSCHNISEQEICSICTHPHREHQLICVVEDVRDVIAIENTHHYKGIYHVLGGKISPMEGIGPSDLFIDSLVRKSETGDVKEIILALGNTMEGDTTNFYLYKKLAHTSVKISTLARGIAFGDELEYADEVTLGRSIIHRVPYEKALPG